ncbi:MAG TPA: hypothetical protein VG838_10180 [Opitutaceae bacterium]|nr:hypothetical protein [Opitutaceae bacterium]
MPTLGIEFCDAGLQVATTEKGEPALLDLAASGAAADWPGFVYHDGRKFHFGRAAEDVWFVHPRSVVHTFLAKLTHEPSSLTIGGKSPSFSELAFLFLRDFAQRLSTSGARTDKMVLAVPGSYLKDAATEEEKIGLLLGMAGELKLPLAGILDMACASLCDPRAGGFNPNLPVVVVDIHLQGAELTLLTAGARLERRKFLLLPQSGYAQLLKQLNGTMGNRFLRHTAFDILADGRIEQAFYRQTKDFLLSDAAEFRFQVNTANRNYEMLVKHEQLTADAHAFVGALVQGLQAFWANSGLASGPCTVALTDRASYLPGLEARLRTAGFNRLLRLPRGAAACGAAFIGTKRLAVPPDLGDVPVDTSVPIDDVCRAVGAPWEARLQKSRLPEPRPMPTHAVIDGIGHVLGGTAGFTVGAASACADLALPEAFNVAGDCLVQLVREGGRLWFVDPAPVQAGAAKTESSLRTVVEAGDQLAIRCGPHAAEVLFVHCEGGVPRA